MRRTTAHTHPQKHWPLPSLSPWYQHPLWFTNWPRLNGLPFFPSTSLFPFLLLSSPPSRSLSLLFQCPSCFLAGSETQEGSVWMSVWTLLPFVSPSPLVSPSFCVWVRVKEPSRGPLNVHRERQGPPLSFIYGDCRLWELNHPFTERRAGSGGGPEIQRGSVSLVGS